MMGTDSEKLFLALDYDSIQSKTFFFMYLLAMRRMFVFEF